jgi:hypothetical protein
MIFDQIKIIFSKTILDQIKIIEMILIQDQVADETTLPAVDDHIQDRPLPSAPSAP